MSTKETIIAEMEMDYDWFRREKMEEPSVAYVKVRFKGDGKTSDNVETIAFDGGCLPCSDGEILYYCSDIYSLIGIVKGDGEECGFEITDFIGYD